MKVFFDTEFTGLHQETTLISIGCVAENGDTFYATLSDYDPAQVDEFVRAHVLPHLLYSQDDKDVAVIDETDAKGRRHQRYYGLNRETCRDRLSAWLKPFRRVEMWSDCLAYDWVLFRNLFKEDGGLPVCVYYIPFDICTLFKIHGIDPDIDRKKFARTEDIKHNALADAYMIKACYERVSEEYIDTIPKRRY